MSVTASRNNRPAALVLSVLAMGVAAATALLLIIAGFGSRLGWWHFRTGFTLLTYGAYGGIGATVLALLAGIRALRDQSKSVQEVSAATEGLVPAIPGDGETLLYSIRPCGVELI